MEQNIYNILKGEHKQVIKDIKKIMKNGTNEDFKKTASDLRMHMRGEEDYFYPLLRDFNQLNGPIIEAFEEHKHAKMVLGELEDTDIDDEEFKPKLKVLLEMIDHHAHEEEKDIFPKAKKVISKEREKGIVDNYMTLKDAV